MFIRADVRMENIIKESTEELFNEFAAKFRNKRTIIEYKAAVNMICAFCRKDFTEITLDDAKMYFDDLYQKFLCKKISRATICTRISMCNAFGKYVETDENHSNYRNPFLHIERPELRTDINPYHIPTIEDIDKILSVAKKKSDMYFFIIVLAVRTGMTASNIVKLTKTDFAEENGNLYIILEDKSKDKKETFIKLPDDVADIARKYLAKAAVLDEKQHIFYNKRGSVLTIRNVDAIVQKVVAESDVEECYTLKDFRSRGILDMLEAGADKEEIAKYTGISNLRINQFVNSPGAINSSCPSDLVNIRIIAE